MSVFENEKLISALEKLKGDILELCRKFPVYK
jgi:hypothetical protein